MLHQFGLETLRDLDGGRVVEAWNQALVRVARDCEDRPQEKKPRKILLDKAVDRAMANEASG